MANSRLLLYYIRETGETQFVSAKEENVGFGTSVEDRTGPLKQHWRILEIQNVAKVDLVKYCGENVEELKSTPDLKTERYEIGGHWFHIDLSLAPAGKKILFLRGDTKADRKLSVTRQEFGDMLYENPKVQEVINDPNRDLAPPRYERPVV